MINATLNSIKDDVAYNVATTWYNCHHSHGDDYIYTNNENVSVELFSTYKPSLDLSIERLKSLDDSLKKI